MPPKKSNNKKKNKKDRKIIARATPKRADFPASANARAALQSLSLHDLDDGKALYYNYCKLADSVLSPNWEKQYNSKLRNAYENRRWQELEDLATQLLEDIKSAEKRHFWDKLPARYERRTGENIGCYVCQGNAIRYRGDARSRLGRFEEAIKDLSEYMVYSKVLRDMADEEKGEGERSGDLLDSYQLDALLRRAHCYEAVGELDKAIVDLETCCAAFRLGCDWEGYPGVPVLALMNLTALMSKKKIDSPRPHYTKEERQRIETRLGIGRRAEEMFHCRGCDHPETAENGVRLRLCSRCEQAWFCCRECQVAAWKGDSGHRQECSAHTKYPIIMSDQYKAQIEASFRDGVGGMSDTQGRHVALLRDPNTGRIFESISDSDVYFIPSDVHLLPEKDVKLHQNIIRRIAARCDGSRTGTMAFRRGEILAEAETGR